MLPNTGSPSDSTILVRTADGSYVPATAVPATSSADQPPAPGRKAMTVETRRMKRQLAELVEPAGPGGGERAAKRQRIEASIEPQPAPLASTEPRTRVLPGEDRAASAQSSSTTTADTHAPSARRIRFQVDTRVSSSSAGPIPTQPVEPPKTAGQMIDENDLRALRSLLQGAERGWSLAAKADLLRHAAAAGRLEAFNMLLEFGALQALRAEAPKAGRQSLLEYAAWGQNLAILDRLEANGLAIHAFARDELMSAIGFSARKGGLPFLQRLCAAADAAGIRFQPADMRKIFTATVQWEKNEHCQRITSPAVMEWLMARYTGSFDASVFAAPLWMSVDVGNWPAAEYLLGVCGASPHLVGESNRSLLMLAAARGRFGLYDLLRFHDADPHAVDATGQTVLHHAVEGSGYRIVADLVLQCRVDTLARDHQGRTAAELAARQGKQNVVILLESQPMKIDYLARL